MKELSYEELRRRYDNALERERRWKKAAKNPELSKLFIQAIAQNDRLIAWTLVLGGSAAAMIGNLLDESDNPEDIVPAAKPWTWILSPSVAINQTILSKIEDLLQGDDMGGAILTLAGSSAAGFGAVYLLLSASSGENDDNPIGKALLGTLGA